MKAGWGVRTRLLVVGVLLMGALAGCAAPDGTPPPASPATERAGGTTTAAGPLRCELDAVEPFVQVPAPGYPVGVAVHEGITYVSTSSGLPNHPGDGTERVFAFTPNGTLTEELVVETTPGATMGLWDMAVDSHDDGYRLYVVDMNGRVLRSQLGPAPGELGETETYATIPAPHGAIQWYGSMPLWMTFDMDGNLYLSDDHGRVWKIPPGGSPTLWLESPRLQGPAGPMVAGAAGARIGPDSKLYLSVTTSGQPDSLAAGIVYRVPTGAPPQEADLEEFARLDPTPESGGPGFTAIAFGASGRLYVVLADWQEIAVFETDGTLDRTISSPLFANPIGLAFHGEDLFVASSDWLSVIGRPEKWQVLRVCVQESGLPLNVPAGIP
jgi:sugar lactone lactonase YvrE